MPKLKGRKPSRRQRKQARAAVRLKTAKPAPAARPSNAPMVINLNVKLVDPEMLSNLVEHVIRHRLPRDAWGPGGAAIGMFTGAVAFITLHQFVVAWIFFIIAIIAALRTLHILYHNMRRDTKPAQPRPTDVPTNRPAAHQRHSVKKQ